LTLLYGERVLSDKEKKKLAKMEKFLAKKEKATEPVGSCVVLHADARRSSQRRRKRSP
jgi:hypothetical protein